MIGLLTTSKKASAGALIAFLSPLYVLYQSAERIDGRAVVAALLAGLIGFLGVWAPTNERPHGKHAER